MHLNDDFTHAEVYCPDEMSQTQRFHISYILMLAYKYTMIANGGFIIHSSTAVFGSECICFCGLSGAGKSTQTTLWEKHLKTWSINYDQPCILFHDGRYLVHGSPWSGKEPCYSSACVPVRAIVFVEKSPEDRVEPIPKKEAFSLLYLNEYVISVQPDTEAVYEAAIQKLVMSVPVYRQFCTKTTNAPRVLHDFLARRDMEDRP